MENAEGSKAPESLFEAVLKRRFGKSTCFLCGKRLGSKNRADEHVISKWVLERYDLWNEDLTLLNRTSIPYRQAVIPCCYDCNNQHLQTIEKAMSEAVEGGPDGVKALDHHSLFLWCGKIYYGLLYRELSLKRDRASRSNQTIINREFLQMYQMHHFFLQSARVPMNFCDFHPASIMVFETQEPVNPKLKWDYSDNHNLFFSCRMGRVGIIAFLQDGGAQRGFFPYFDEYKTFALHPLQFQEIVAKCFYKSLLFNRTPKYIMVNDDPILVMQLPLGGFSNKPLYDEWSQEHYAFTLSRITGIPMEQIYYPPDKVMSWLRNEDGSLKHFDSYTMPWPISEAEPSSEE